MLRWVAWAVRRQARQNKLRPAGTVVKVVVQRSAIEINYDDELTGADVLPGFRINVADIFYLINALFANGPPPVHGSDVNGDGIVNVADVFFLINRLFAGGAGPACAS